MKDNCAKCGAYIFHDESGCPVCGGFEKEPDYCDSCGMSENSCGPLNMGTCEDCIDRERERRE